jgi:transcriptional regulator with XRE-family HTH domain
MLIAERLKSLRLYRRLSQGDIEKRTGLLRCYISRVENGHSTPVIETLEKMARAMDIPLYALFYDGEAPPKRVPKPKPLPGGWGSSGRDAQVLAKFREFLSRTNDADINFLLFIAEKMVQKKKAQERSSKKASTT